MGRITGAILVGWLVVMCGTIKAQEPSERGEIAAGPQPPGEQHVEQREGPAVDYAVYLESGAKAARDQQVREQFEKLLNSPLKSPLQCEEQPLNELFDQISVEYDLPIVFDTAALDALAISPDTEVTINFRNISLRQAMNLVLRQPGLEDLTYIFEDGVLLITTEEKANEFLSVRVYRVDDLIEKYDLASPQKPYSSLIKIITTNVAYGSWSIHERGEGEIQLMRPGLLVVSQTQRIHEQVQELLGMIRMITHEVEHSEDTRQVTAASGRGGSF